MKSIYIHNANTPGGVSLTMAVDLFNPIDWKTSCKESIIQLYELLTDAITTPSSLTLSDSEISILKDLSAQTDKIYIEKYFDMKKLAKTLLSSIYRLMEYCSRPDSKLRDNVDYKDFSLYASSLLSILLFTCEVFEQFHEATDYTAPNLTVFDFSDSFSRGALARRVMGKLEQCSESIDFARFAIADEEDLDLKDDALSLLWYYLGDSLERNGCLKSAMRLYACSYNIGVLQNTNNRVAASAIEHACAALNTIGEYERAAALCCHLLYGAPRANLHLTLCEGFSPCLFGELSSSFALKMSLAKALSSLADRLERVTNAGRSPSAALELDERFLGEYFLLTKELRLVAYNTIIPHEAEEDATMRGAAANECVHLLLAMFNAFENPRSGKNDSLKSHSELLSDARKTQFKLLTEGERVAQNLGDDSAQTMALRLRLLFSRLALFSCDGRWYGPGGIQDTDRILSDLHQLISSLLSRNLARTDKHDDTSLRDLEMDYSLNFLRTCSSLLEEAEHAEDENARRDIQDIVIGLVHVATHASKLRKLRTCVFTTDADYVTKADGKTGQLCELIDYYSNGLWGNNSSKDAFQLAKHHNMCLAAELNASENASPRNRRIAYYTTLNTAHHLFDLLYKPDGSIPALPAEDLSDDANTGPAKNCLTVMHASYMNDPNEGASLFNHLGCPSLHPFKDEWEGVQERVIREGMVFLKSFTTQVDQLHMWSMYGSDNAAAGDCDGCCVCFSRDMFANMEGSDPGSNSYALDEGRLYKVIYLDEENRVVDEDKNDAELVKNYITSLKSGLRMIHERLGPRIIDDISYEGHRQVNDWARFGSKSSINIESLRNLLTDTLAPIAFLVKDSSYSREQEIRLIINRPLDANKSQEIRVIPTTPVYRSRLCVNPFQQVGIDEIILGPKCPNPHEVVPYLTLKLNEMKRKAADSKIGMEGKVRMSKIRYR